MRRFWIIVSAALFLVSGCANGRDMIAPVKSVKEMRPGYAIVVATFEYVPGKSSFQVSAVYEDAYFVAQRLYELGYESFLVPLTPYKIKVAVRASTEPLARATKMEIDRDGVINIGVQKLKVPKTEIINLSELKLAAIDSFHN